MKNLEIENKYLLSYHKSIEFLKTIDNCESKKITQIYIEIFKNRVKRIRKIGNRYIFTVKKGSGKIRYEKERDISKKQFLKLSKKRIGNKIEKTRYFFNLKGNRYELDIFKGKLNGLVFLEIEFKNPKQMKNFVLPKRLKNLVIKDVSTDINYTNSSLAIPKKSSFNILDIYKKIELNQDKEAFSFKPAKDTSIFDTIRVFLYLYLTLIKKYIVKIKYEDGEENLHQFRINLRRSRSLLSVFKEVLDENIYRKMSSALKKIAVQTNKKRDLDVLISSLKKLKNADNLSDFIYFLEIKQREEDVKIKNLIESVQLQETLFDMELLLKDETDFYTTKLANLPTHQYARKKIKYLIKKMTKNLNKLNKKTSLGDFHSIRIQIKKIRYLVDIFDNIYKKDTTKKINKKFKKYQTIFGKLNDLHNQKKIVNDAIHQYNLHMETLKDFSQNLSQDLKHQKAKIISIINKK